MALGFNTESKSSGDIIPIVKSHIGDDSAGFIGQPDRLGMLYITLLHCQQSKAQGSIPAAAEPETIWAPVTDHMHHVPDLG